MFQMVYSHRVCNTLISAQIATRIPQADFPVKTAPFSSKHEPTRRPITEKILTI